jgi:hypothetical protein
MARPSRHDFTNEETARFGGCATGIHPVSAFGIDQAQKTGMKAQRLLRERLQARDDRTLQVVRKGEQLFFNDWVAFFMENYSKPPIRAAKTHEANGRAMMHLQRAFGLWRLVDVTVDDIEQFSEVGSRNAPS